MATQMDPSMMAPDNLGPGLLAVAWVFASIATFVVASRFYVRIWKIQKLGIDDWLILVTYIFAICNSAFVSVSVSWGLGRHIGTLQPVQIMNSVKYIYICEFFTIMAPGIGRISYAFLLLQLLPPNKGRRRFLWTIITFQFIIDVGTVIITYAQCRPIQAFWEETPGACWSPIVQEYTGFFQGSFCSAVDLLLALFPASMLWNLNMKLSAKICLSGLMGLGVFAMVASIIKTIQLRAISEKGDATYAMAILAICFTLEAYLVLIAASIPTLRPLMSVNRGTTRGTEGKSGGSHYDSNSRPFSMVRTGLGRERTEGSLTEGNFMRLPGNVHNTAEFKQSSSDGESLYGSRDGAVADDTGIPLGAITKQTSMRVDYENGPVGNTEGSAHHYV